MGEEGEGERRREAEHIAVRRGKSGDEILSSARPFDPPACEFWTTIIIRVGLREVA
jgi:hypothetical protein